MTGEMIHEHEHVHENNHDHLHTKEKIINLTPWVLIIIFVLGPCEVLIPMLMYPAAEHGTMGVVLVSSVFAIATICHHDGDRIAPHHRI